MRPDLERIWKMSFPDDPPEKIRYFFDRRYNPNTCIVYVDPVSGRPVSMMHLIDAFITDDNEIAPSLYIYAAATRPDFRGQGLMSKLLNASQQYAQAGKRKYTIAAPGTSDRFHFLEKRGFYRCFANREMSLTRKDMETLCDYKGNENKEKKVFLGDEEMYRIRRDALVDREGYVCWDKRQTAFAMGMCELDGGEIIAVRKGYDTAYAFCRPVGTEKVEVMEFVASSDLSKPLCRAILDSFYAGIYEVKVALSNEFFAPYGDAADYGVIKAHNGRRPTNLLTLSGRHTPYLGLAVD